MKVGGAAMLRGRRAPPLNTLLSHTRSRFLCSCSSSQFDHVSFITDVAATQPPKHLPHLLSMLQARGESIVSPGAKLGLVPLAIPLAKNNSGVLTALLRWPTAPSGMEMPVVEVHKHGVWLLAKSVDQFIHRTLVEEDANNSYSGNDEIFLAAADAGEKLYMKGDFEKSQVSNLDNYLLKKVGLFPDVLERKVMHHFVKGDHVSALVTTEFYTKKQNFPGFARPFVFNAEVLLKVGRKEEAKDAARGALTSAWWTLGCKYHEVASIAQWKDEQIKCIREKLTDKGREADLERGKPPAQAALDEAAFLLDLASVEGTWEDSVELVAECYKKAGFHDIAKFVLFRD